MQLRPASSAPSPGKPAATGLRGILGGYDLDRWPINVGLKHDETLISWWTRLAHRYEVSPASLFAEVGMRKEFYAPTLTDGLLGAPQENLTKRTGVDDAQRAAALERHRSTLRSEHNLAATYVLRPLPVPTGSRFCPRCLLEDQMWRSEWRHPWIIACVHHKTMLLTTCPECGSQPFSTFTWARRLRSPSTCTEYSKRPGRGRGYARAGCTADLATIPAPLASEELIRAIRLIRPTPGQPEQVELLAGKQVTRSHASAALNLLANEDRHSVLGQRLATSDRHIETSLVKASRILNQSSLEEAAALADEYDLLRVHGRLTPIGPGRALAQAPLDPLLHAIRLQGLHDKLPPSTQLAFRIGSSWPRVPRELRHTATLKLKHEPSSETPPVPMSAVPQLWWPQALQGFDLTGDERAQFAISIAVTCIGRSITVASAAEWLGAPKLAAAKVASTWRRIAGQSGWPNLRHALLTAADQLNHDPAPIDYTARREALASPEEFDLCGEKNGLETSFSDPEKLWIWSHLTQSSPRFTPYRWEDLRAPHIRPEAPADWKLQLVHRLICGDASELERWEPP